MEQIKDPFFSIIIPCYNSKKTIKRLLNSIVDQNMSYDIEVILSDDHSTESYEDEIKSFYNKLCIKKISTDYNCCPGNTREKGVSIATGTWLLFADHDDVFLPKTFREIKRQILKNNENNIAYCNIYRAKNTEGKFTENLIEMKMTKFTGLLHGKLFNRENFWNKYNIHFKKDMFTHEDTYVTTVIRCILEQYKLDPLHIDLFNYVWFNNGKSLSNSTGLKSFLEEHFHYYSEATFDVYKDFYDRGLVDINFSVYNMIRIVLNEYFYMQMFLFSNPESYNKENVKICIKDLVTIKKMFNMSNVDIFWYCGENNAKLYTSVAIEAGFGYIPNYSLMEWMNTLNKDN